MIKKADIILSSILIIVGIIVSCLLFIGKSDGKEVLIEVDGKLYASYSLDEDREIPIKNNGHINEVLIKKGTVSMTSSDCHGQDCVEHHSISKSGENIICLPNKVVVEIKGGKEEYDALSK